MFEGYLTSYLDSENPNIKNKNIKQMKIRQANHVPNEEQIQHPSIQQRVCKRKQSTEHEPAQARPLCRKGILGEISRGKKNLQDNQTIRNTHSAFFSPI